MPEGVCGNDPIPILLSSGTPTPVPAQRPQRSQRRPASCIDRPTTVLGEVALPEKTCLIAEGAVINGHMSHIHFQDFTVVGVGAVVRPPLRATMSNALAQCPATLSIGAFTVLGDESVCEAAAVGKYVRVDRRCVIGCGATIADGVWLKEGTWVPPETVLTPFTVYGGCPAVSLGKLNPEACKLLQMEHVRALLNFPS